MDWKGKSRNLGYSMRPDIFHQGSLPEVYMPGAKKSPLWETFCLYYKELSQNNLY